MSTLTLGVATCGDLNSLYWNSEYGSQVSDYEILEKFAQAYGLDSSEYETVEDRCPSLSQITSLKTDANKNYFQVTASDYYGQIIQIASNQLVVYDYVKTLCVDDGCSSDNPVTCPSECKKYTYCECDGQPCFEDECSGNDTCDCDGGDSCPDDCKGDGCDTAYDDPNCETEQSCDKVE